MKSKVAVGRCGNVSVTVPVAAVDKARRRMLALDRLSGSGGGSTGGMCVECGRHAVRYVLDDQEAFCSRSCVASHLLGYVYANVNKAFGVFVARACRR